MSKITLNNLVNLQNETTAVNTINSNSTTIQNAFDNTLSRDGSAPNQMNSTIDMNSNHIINLPHPSSDFEPLRLVDITAGTTLPGALAKVNNLSDLSSVPTALINLGLNNVNNTSDLNKPVSTATAAAIAAAVGNFYVIPSRANAITLNIGNTISGIITLGYSNSGDGGASIFKNAGTTPFIDSYITTGNIAGGAGYVNGTYYGVPLTAGTGIGAVAKITVSGTAVTSLSLSTQPGNGYAIGDVLTTSNSFLGGSGTGFTFTVTGVSTTTASFTDAGGTRWQYVGGLDGTTNINHFGAKADYINTDVGVTDNFPFIQNALFYGGRHGGTSADASGYVGDVVMCGQGSYMLNSPASGVSLIVPTGVTLQGISGTTLKFANAFDISTHCVILGDPNSHQACFRSKLKNIVLYFSPGISVNSNIFMVYSNNTQDGGGLEDVYLYCGNRGGVFFEIGYGGASTINLSMLSINLSGPTAAVLLNLGTTIIDAKNIVIGGPSVSNNTTNGIVLQGTGGMYNFEGVHVEEVPTGILINITNSAGMVTLKNATGGTGLTSLVTLASSNIPGNFSMQQCQKNGATNLVVNGQPGGTSRTADVQPKDGIVFFNP